jgi:hypothetical protein
MGDDVVDDGTWKTESDISEKERYQRYLASREWGLLKAQVKARSGGICERCKLNPSDAVHHLTYERKYNEDLADLQDTCEACHKYTHGLSDDDPVGIPVTLTGAFVSDSLLFIFFQRDDQSKSCPDNEVYTVAWNWGANELIADLTGDEELEGGTLIFKDFHLGWLLGRKYKVKLGEESSGCPMKVTSFTIDKTRERNLGEWGYPGRSFIISASGEVPLQTEPVPNKPGHYKIVRDPM